MEVPNDPWEVSVRKIVAKIIAKKDSDIFRAPVPYEELGLNDYIEIVKEPMDLGTVLKKLDGKEYACQDDCAKDVRRIWVNALLYNMPGSKIYTTAKALSESFELNYLPLARDDVNRPPNAEEMTSWVAGNYTYNLLSSILTRTRSLCYLLFCSTQCCTVCSNTYFLLHSTHYRLSSNNCRRIRSYNTEIRSIMSSMSHQTNRIKRSRSQCGFSTRGYI